MSRWMDELGLEERIGVEVAGREVFQVARFPAVCLQSRAKEWA